MQQVLQVDPPAWSAALRLLKRPQPVTVAMVVLFASIPFYIVIGDGILPGREAHVPELLLDRVLPVLPSWSLVYASLFLAALLPVFVVHQQELVRRTIHGFLFLWLASFAVFLAYPTVATRAHTGSGDFFSWMLRQIYAMDTRRNCFPSLHVAQSYLAAAVCGRVHRGVGRWAFAWATLVALSTLFTKQHYVLDVLGGMALAWGAHSVFVRDFVPARVPREERDLAPTLAAAACAVYGLALLFIASLYVAGFSLA